MRCSRCHEPIGVYEPVRVVHADGSERRGSMLTLADEIRRGEGTVVHEGCYVRAADSPLR